MVPTMTQQITQRDRVSGFRSDKPISQDVRQFLDCAASGDEGFGEGG